MKRRGRVKSTSLRAGCVEDGNEINKDTMLQHEKNAGIDCSGIEKVKRTDSKEWEWEWF